MSSISETTVYKVDTNSSLNDNYVTEEKGNKKAQKVLTRLVSFGILCTRR